VLLAGTIAALGFQGPAVARVVSNQVLILAPTVAYGMNSVEATAVTNAGFTPVVVDAATWSSMSTTDFASYRAIVLGDPTCQQNYPQVLDDTAQVWGPAVDGNAIVVGTDPTYHVVTNQDPVGPTTLINDGIAFSVGYAEHTGLFASLSCYFEDTPAGTHVSFLDGLGGGGFSVKHADCWNDSHIIITHQSMANLNDGMLSNWRCSVHEVFDQYPISFLPLVIARGYDSSVTGFDGSTGAPYILARGEGLIANTIFGPLPLPQTFGHVCNCLRSLQPNQSVKGDPVNTATGAFTESYTDARLPAPGTPFTLTRSYTSLDTTSGPMGPGWTFDYNASLAVDPGTGDATIRAEDGQQAIYKSGAGVFDTPAGARSKLASISGGYRLTKPDRSTMTFDPVGHVTSSKDRFGTGLSMGYTGNQVTQITDAAGHVVNLTYTSGLLTRATLPDGRHVDYGYTGGYLTSVTDLRGKVTTYAYDAGHRLTSALDPDNHYMFRNTYDSTSGRVVSQLDPRGNETTFAWNPTTQTATTTDPRGGMWNDVYAGNVLTKQTNPLGNSTWYGYDKHLNRVSVTDARGETTLMSYNADGKMLSRTTPGKTSSYTESWTYNTAGAVLTHTDFRGNTTTNTYNGQGLLATVTDARSHTTQYTYNNLGEVDTVTSPRGKVTHYGYDTAGNLTSVTKPSGAKTTMTYDAAGRQKTVVDPRGNLSGADPTKYTTSYTYDENDHVTTVTDARAGVTTNTYDDAGLLSQQTNAATKTTAYSYYPDNRVHTVTDPRSNTTTFAYYADGSLTDVTTPEGAHTSYDFDLAGHQIQKVDPRGNAAGATKANYTWTYTVDENGNRKTTSHPDPNGGPDLSRYTTYDGLNRPRVVSDWLGNFVETWYDGNSNVIRVKDGAGRSTFYDYYPDNRLHTVTDGRGKITTFDYDDDGNRTKVTTPLGEITTYGYDDDEQLTSMLEPRGNVSGANAANYTWTYGYDKAGNPTTTVNPLTQTISTLEWDATNNRSKETDGTGDVTSWTYDAMNRVATVKGPDTNTTSYTYDNNGNLATRTDPNSHITNFGYDKDNHLTTTTTPLSRVWTNSYNLDGQLTQTITPVGAATPSDPNDGIVAHDYDSLGRLTQTRVSGQANTDYGYDLAGRVTTMTDESGTETYVYNQPGQLTSVTRTGTGTGSSPATYGYQYDDAGNLTHRDLPDGISIDTTYDDDERPATLTRTSANNAAVTVTYGYDPASNPTGLLFPNGDTETRTYDRAGRLTKIRTTNGPNNATTGTGVTLIAQHEQVLNADGQPTSLTSTQGTVAPAVTTYAYTANRLTHTVTPDGWTTDIQYDNIGNRALVIRSGNVLLGQLPTTTVSTYDADDEQTINSALSGLAYDTNGNQTNDGAGNTYTYDAAGHLRTRTNAGATTSYTYAGDGRRLTATTAGKTTRYAWDINNPLPMLTSEVRPTTGTNTDSWDYLTTPDGRTLRADTTPTGGSTTTSWLHTDPIGSITETTTPTGALAHTYTYDPNGQPLTNVNVVAGHDSPLRFTGEYLDPDGTYNLRGRHYQPTQGRFTQTDPLPAAVADPYVAAYVYAANSPTSFIDPSGMSTCGVFAALCWASEQVGSGIGHVTSFGEHVVTGTYHDMTNHMPGCAGHTLEECKLFFFDLGTLGMAENTFQDLGDCSAEDTIVSASCARSWLDLVMIGTMVKAGCLTGVDGATEMGLSGADLLASQADVLVSGDLTAAGRALAKHGGRTGSAFPEATGSQTAISDQAGLIVRDILDNQTRRLEFYSPRLKMQVVDIYDATGRGLRYSKDGEFIGFLEPPR
jgi:RHS repeat-associated protein